LDGVPICVIVTDAERAPYYWNRSALLYAGIANFPEEFSRSLFDFVHGDDRGHLAAEWTTAEHGKCQFKLKFRLRSSDGSYRWHLGRGVPQLNDSQVITGWILSATDIEDQHRALANAEAANRVKDEFLAVVSHELRNPLNAIIGWVHLLRSGLDAAKIQRAVETIERNVNLQVSLIDEILDLSRIVRDKVRLLRRPIDLTGTVQSSLTAMRSAAQSKGIEIEWQNAGRPISVNGDPERLQQIISNLVSNAIKFTPGGGQVTVTLTGDGDEAKLMVSDTGIGIAPEFLPHVFDPFRQAEATTTREQGGLGLGLAISKRLVELHGGAVRAESGGRNRGANFTVTLPLLSADVQVRHDSGHQANLGARSLNGLRILIVDDDPDTREILSEILASHGAEVVVASSAHGAMAEIAESAPDVLVSDIAMPGEDGLSLMRRLGQYAASRDHRIITIAVTGLSAPQHRRLALEAGFEACLNKPLEPARLVDYIVTATSRSATPN
ncbi:MAG: response regulator, partial [Acidobacteria bacterium]|nr:response regulator [Acidobacteriota bacterium]